MKARSYVERKGIGRHHQGKKKREKEFIVPIDIKKGGS